MRVLLCVFTLAFPALWGCQYLESDSAAAESSNGETATADSTADADRAGADSTRMRIDAVPVEIALAIVGEISSFLLFSSTVETEASVEIHPEVSGLVEEVRVEEGDRVAAGDTLVLLDAEQARIDDRESALNLRHLEAGYNRTEEMYRRKLISAQAHEDQLFRLEESRLRREKARLALEHTAIRAPFSGVITSREVQVGARVAPGVKLYELIKLDDMIAKVFVPGRYLTTIKRGQRAEVESDFLEGMRFRGYVKRISPVVDPKSGTFKVTVSLRDRWEYLRPGIFVNVKVVTDTHASAILLPKEAIVYDGGDRYVFIVTDSTATKVKVDVGYENSEHVEALSLIEADTPIIVVGQNGLRDRAKVRIVNAKAQQKAAPEGQG